MFLHISLISQDAQEKGKELLAVLPILTRAFVIGYIPNAFQPSFEDQADMPFSAPESRHSDLS